MGVELQPIRVSCKKTWRVFVKNQNNFLTILLFERELPSMGKKGDVSWDFCPSLKDWEEWRDRE